jgi:6-phosphogluconolactonase/glucosamine-6-phosphate isomerase/deaminase
MNYVYTDKPIELAANHVADVLKEHLSNSERVLWLMTGGSGLLISVLASKKLEGTPNLLNLFVTLTDERFGPVGHKDENWQQLLDMGFDLPSANLYRPLIGENTVSTATKFADWLDEKLEITDYSIGLFGLGTDGHTAGIKPHSPAVTASSLAVSYKGDDFERVTIGFSVIRQIDEAIIQVSGDNKRKVLRELIFDSLPLDTQPAQILKEIPNLTIYSNNPKEEQS